jgi:hypothetical protein
MGLDSTHSPRNVDRNIWRLCALFDRQILIYDFFVDSPPASLASTTKHQRRTVRHTQCVSRTYVRLASTRPSKGSCTLNLEDEDVLYSLQQRPLNGPLNLENVAGSSICRVSLNGSLSI